MDLEEVAAVLGAGFVAVLVSALDVVVVRGFGGFEFGGEHDVGVAVLGCPVDGVAAHDARDPDGGVRGLVGAGPRVHVAELIVVALPAIGPGGRPGFDDEIVGFLETFPVVWRLSVVGDAFATGTANPAGDEAAAGDHVDFREFFGKPEGVIPDGEDVTEEDDLCALGDASEDGCLDVHHSAHAEGRAVMLVEHEAVEAHLLGVDLFVEVAVIEVGAEFRVVLLVADAKVLDIAAGGAEVARAGVLVGAFRKVAYEHWFDPFSGSGAANVRGDEPADTAGFFVFDVMASARDDFQPGIGDGLCILLTADGRDDAVFAAPNEERARGDAFEQMRQLVTEHERLPTDAGRHLPAVVPEFTDGRLGSSAVDLLEVRLVPEAGNHVVDVAGEHLVHDFAFARLEPGSADKGQGGETGGVHGCQFRGDEATEAQPDEVDGIQAERLKRLVHEDGDVARGTSPIGAFGLTVAGHVGHADRGFAREMVVKGQPAEASG